MDGSQAADAFREVWQAAETHGKTLYDELLAKHRERLAQERENGAYGFAARRRVAERLGLPAVRSYRLAQLEQEERVWHQQLAQRADVQPELVPLLLVRVEGGR